MSGRTEQNDRSTEIAHLQSIFLDIGLLHEELLQIKEVATDDIKRKYEHFFTLLEDTLEYANSGTEYMNTLNTIGDEEFYEHYALVSTLIQLLADNMGIMVINPIRHNSSNADELKHKKIDTWEYLGQGMFRAKIGANAHQLNDFLCGSNTFNDAKFILTATKSVSQGREVYKDRGDRRFGELYVGDIIVFSEKIVEKVSLQPTVITTPIEPIDNAQKSDNEGFMKWARDAGEFIGEKVEDSKEFIGDVIDEVGDLIQGLIEQGEEPDYLQGAGLALVVYKDAGEMYVYYGGIGATEKTLVNNSIINSQPISVVTNIVEKEPDNTVVTDIARVQKNMTHPTQMHNGTYPISWYGSISDAQNRYGTGDQGLIFDYSATLPKQISEENGQYSNTGESIIDKGYMIHITPNDYTNGCIGISYEGGVGYSREEAEAIIDWLVEKFKEAYDGGNDATITIND